MHLKKNEREIGMVTSVVFGCFSSIYRFFFHHMHKGVLIDSFPFEGFEINLKEKREYMQHFKGRGYKEKEGIRMAVPTG